MSRNDKKNPLLDALLSSGNNLDQLGTVFGQLPQTIDILQKVFASGANENEKQNGHEGSRNSEGHQVNSLLDALGLDGLNLDELGTVLQKLPQTIETLQKLFSSGGIENFERILVALQQKVEDRIQPTKIATNTCPQPDVIDIFLFEDPFEEYQNDDEETEEHEEFSSDYIRDEL